MTTTATIDAPTVVTADPELIRQHLTTLFEPAVAADTPGHVAISSTDNKFPPRFFRPAELNAMVEFCAKMARVADVYVSASLVDADSVRKRGQYARGLETEVTAVCALRYDQDVPKADAAGNYPSQAEHFRALGEMPIPHTLVNDSGSGGLHVYYVFVEPIGIGSPADLAKLRAVSRGYLDVYRKRLGTNPNGVTYDVDSTFDLVRVLRVAGTRNHRTDLLVRPLEYHPTRTCDVGDFEPYAATSGNDKVDTSLPAQSQPVSTWLEGVDRQELIRQAREWLAEFDPAVSGRNGHSVTYAAACRLIVGFALSIKEALPLMREYSTRCKPPWSETEILHKLESANNRPGTRGGLYDPVAAPFSTGTPADVRTPPAASAEMQPAQQQSGDDASSVSKFVPVTREDMLRILNRALVGKFGGRVEVVAVEKIGEVNGTYYLRTKAGGRVVLGTIKQVMRPGPVREAVADQTRVVLPLYKKGWPGIANAIVQLAEIKQTESAVDRVAAWVQEYAEHCLPFWSKSEHPVGSLEWKREKYPKMKGHSQMDGCLFDEHGALCLHLKKFIAFTRCEDYRVQRGELVDTMVQLGFASKHKLQVRFPRGQKQCEVRVWKRDGGVPE